MVEFSFNALRIAEDWCGFSLNVEVTENKDCIPTCRLPPWCDGNKSKYNKFLLVDALLVVLERTSCVDCNGDGVANLDVTYGCSKYFKKLENMENYIMEAL